MRLALLAITWIVLCKPGFFEGDNERNEVLVRVNPGIPLRYTLHGQQPVKVSIIDHLDNASLSYALLQVHSQWRNVTMSLDSGFSLGQTVQDSSVSTVQMLSVDQREVSWYVRVGDNSTQPLNVVLYAQLYAYTVPIPGGCNMEFVLQLDPNVHVISHSVFMKELQFQYAHPGVIRGQEVYTKICDNLTAYHLHYVVLQFALNHGDISEPHVLSRMTEILSSPSHRLNTYSHRLKEIQQNIGKTDLSVVTHPGQASILVIFVQQIVGRSTVYAPYTARVIYGGTWINGQLVSPSMLAVKIICIFLALVGLLLCFAGHRFFSTAMFIFGHLAIQLSIFLLLAHLTRWNITASVSWSAAIGLLGGTAWCAMWLMLGIPVLSVLLGGLEMGFLFSGVIFNLTPFGQITGFDYTFTFAITFICLVLAPMVFLLYFTRMLSIISCAVVGSYLTLLAVDIFFQGALLTVLLHSALKFTGVMPPKTDTLVDYQSSDIILLTAWPVLVLTGVTVQWYRERKRPPFPPPPQWRTLLPSRSPYPRPLQVRNADASRDESSDEEAPLIGYRPEEDRLQRGPTPVVDPI